MKKTKTDFLVIGSGLAGLYTAQYASGFGSVALLTKSSFEVSNSFWAQGGIAAVIGTDDNVDLHYHDTIQAGRRLCNSDAVKILVEEGRERVLELLELGVPFDRENGRVALGLEGGHSKRRVLHANGDATGKELVNYFSNLVKNNNRIKIFENTIIYKLAVSANHCFGAYSYNYLNKESNLFLSPFTIIATGGASGIYTRTTNPHTSTGDGISLAWEAGAEVTDMELIQFHPTSFYSETGNTFLISEAVRGEGAYLVNGKNERFMKKIDPGAELAPRDVVATAIVNELASSKTNNVYLKLDHLDPEKIRNRFSHIYEEALKFGIDITSDPVPVAPAAHYTIGGIKTGLYGETNINGLFACGETAANGVHGANRLASNSLLECIVFGKRVVDKILTTKKNTTGVSFPEIDFKVNENKKETYSKLKIKLANLITDKVGIVRSKKSIKEAFDELDIIYSQFTFEENEYYGVRLKSQVEICRLIARSALLREESRGVHKRTDFVNEEASMCLHIVQKKNEKPYFIKQ